MHNDMYVGMPQFEIFFFFLNCKINIIVLSQAPRKVFGYALKHNSPLGSRIQFILSCMAGVCFLSSSSYDFQSWKT